ncbi:nucleolar protein 14 [Fomitopsis serialis]|uniref:nucleolar protein 14 n=1 Tax=Fomitopsis serialis TaxID=139415 RepID=UPI002008E006|nr:nucleolar protein 14 [Neoantrodia serialis]KAH9938114.1 nucleolar protein 14 [Neoantrodia serialis]
MAKGSQLSQLKAALNQAGLSRPQQNGKKRKRAVMEERDKEKKAEKLKNIQQRMNPSTPARTEQAGWMEQRKQTLLKELQERNRAGGIVDRRFGENDPTLTPEERMLERFTREHQRASKGAAFNLEDEDELTHYGQNLSKLDDFDNVGLGLDDDEDEDEGRIDRSTVQQSHFGGFGDEEEQDEDDEPARKKTKAEVMSEMQRQTEQEEDENLRHELDQQLDSIRSLFSPQIPPRRHLKHLSNRSSRCPEASDGRRDRSGQEYDQYVRELVFEQRAKPKDRTKTEEEMALEEKEALERAERRRIRRMNGESEEGDEEEGGAKGAVKGKRAKQKGGDDLEDDFMKRMKSEEDDDDEMGEGESDEEDEEEDSDEEEEDGEEEDEEVASDDTGDIEAEGGESEALVTSGKKKVVHGKSPSKELRFTFPCPSSHDEFLELVEDVEDKDVPTVVQRIRTLHHPSLAEDNKFKLQGLTSVLVDHILYITSPPTPRLTLLSSLVPHLYALTKSYPIQSAEHFISKLNLMHKNLKRGLSRGATEPDAKTWPGLPELSLLRVISQIWPTSDKNHSVVSPARLLMGAYLGLARVRSLQDLTSGLFLCTLFLQYEQLSKRFVPEAINFLANATLHLAPHKFSERSAVPGCFPFPDFGSEHCPSFTLVGKKVKDATIKPPSLLRLLNANDFSEQDKVDLLGLTLDLLGRFADIYKGLDGFIELYEPISELLTGVKSSSLPSSVSARVTSLRDTFGRLLKFSQQARRPLTLQSHKPIPIPTYVPKFEQSSSNYLKNRDPDHERNEATKLRRQYKQERKGAIRELRKDARFLAAEQQKQQKEKDSSYNERMKRVLGSLESERAEEKAMEREKMKDKKRAGRK